ncbi:MAG TPA: mechanosensitive ion channel family protein [Gammaproteobacteria bacterium]|nr:mechanosensitive ion channel family protein [Gammaproteobacteria bacterium]
MIDFNELLSLAIFGNSPITWLMAVAVTGGAFVVLLVARRTVRRYHRRFEETNAASFARIPLQVLSRTAVPFFLVLALFVGAQVLTMGSTTARVLASAITIALFWQAGIWAVATASAWLEHKRRRSLAADRAALGSISIIGVILNAVIWALVVLLTLDNLGIDITALVAGLGIGGIAVALAVQNIFGDLFASLSITLDRPFVVGDFLIVGDVLGTVETIGIKSTRLRSLSGEQIVMPNSDLLSSRVRNYGRMMERRVVFATGVTYETSIEILERIPGLIRDIVEGQADTRFDRSHFAAHGAASLNFETVYYVRSPDYNRYMDIQQAINLCLHREFTKLGIEFAYPTQKIFVASIPLQEAA